MPKTKTPRVEPVVMVHAPLCRHPRNQRGIAVITPVEMDGTIWTKQGGRCFICGQELELAVWQYVTITAPTQTGAN